MEHNTEPGPAESSDTLEDGNGVGPAEPGIQPGDPASGAGDKPGTGEPRVDAALELLDKLPGLPVSEHPELFEQVHAQLAEVLGELDSGSGGPAGQIRS